MLATITTILTVILVFICLLMSLIILMQRPKQEGLGAAFGGGIADKMLGSGTTDFLQRATVMMGVAFFVLSLTIATLMAYDRAADREAGVDALKEAAAAEAKPEDADGADSAVPPIDLQSVGAPEVTTGAAGVVDEAAGVVDEAAGVVDEAAGVVDEAAGVVDEAAGVEEAADVVEEAADVVDEAVDVVVPDPAEDAVDGDAPAEEPAADADAPTDGN